jgi:hypothetical protein
MAKLTDPGIPAVNKGDIVTPGIAPDEAGTIDDHLIRMHAFDLLPLPFVVRDVEPAPNNFAGATVNIVGGSAETPVLGPSCWSIRAGTGLSPTTPPQRK